MTINDINPKLIVLNKFCTTYFTTKMEVCQMLKIKEIREQKGLSKYKVSKDSGISYVRYTDLERGADPRVSTLKKIADALGVDIKELFN